MKTPSKIKSLLRSALLLFAGMVVYCVPITATASDSCYGSADLPRPTCSISYCDYVYISWSSFTACSSFGGYVVYRSTSSTFNWSTATELNTIPTQNTYYYDYSAAIGTTYYYWIGVKDSSTGSTWVNYDRKDWGKRNCGDCCETIANPQPTAVCNSSYIYISWPAFGSCSSFSGKYAVYRSTLSTFSWSSVKKLTETYNRYYYDYSASSGQTYYYWIGVYCNSKWYVQSTKYVSISCGDCCETIANPQPTAVCNSSYIYISWPAFGSCSSFSGKYAVYRSTSSTFSWSSVKKLTETYNRYYYDYSASSGQTYYYWIGVYCNSKWYVQTSKYVSVKCTNCCQTVANPQPTVTSYNSYNYISWSAFGSCSSFSGKYAVYRSTSSTFSWSSVKKLTETYNRYYYDYSASSGQTYYYWIGVYCDGKWYVDTSKYASGQCGDCCQRGVFPKPTVTSYSTYNYISWSAFGSCSSFSGKYVLYRSTSSTFNWSTVKKLSVTYNRYYYDYSCGTKYYYWVGVECNGKYYVDTSKYASGQCTGDCMQTVANPQPTVSYTYSGYIYISWPAFGSCSSFSGKYAVYRSTSSTFSWSSVKKLTETYNRYYYDYSASPGQTYYYWIGVLGNDGKWYVQSSKYDWGWCY